jgi:hypothetical protein
MLWSACVGTTDRMIALRWGASAGLRWKIDARSSCKSIMRHPSTLINRFASRISRTHSGSSSAEQAVFAGQGRANGQLVKPGPRCPASPAAARAPPRDRCTAKQRDEIAASHRACVQPHPSTGETAALRDCDPAEVSLGSKPGSFGDVGSMAGLHESGHGWTIYCAHALAHRDEFAEFVERKIMECETPLRHSPLTFAAVMIGVQRAISLLTSTASGC